MRDMPALADIDAITIRKHHCVELRFTRRKYHGHGLKSVRVRYNDGKGELRPSKQGLAFRAELRSEVLSALTYLQKRDLA